MSINQSPKIVTDGLVFYVDMNNGKSFVGGPVTNTIPTPSINALPTYGNGWGTYNTNQYGSGTYFSIGSVASVSGNIVTMTAAHSLRSYDVMQPQTTGGGVTAGTNYLIKKLSATTFTLHPYNGSQDGSQGYINPATGNHKVYDDFVNDVRISVNSSSFPTMWWGAPHLPNSALVKEIIPNGFTGIPGRPPTDCIRLHFNRTDATDGMAYSVDASVVAGTPYTVSFWARAVSPSAVGTTGSYQIYNYGSTTPTGASVGYTLGPVGEWRKYTLTFTPNNPLAISYWFPGSGGQKHDIANIQFEAGSVANNFVAGTRSSTEVLKDLTGNYVLTPTNLSYSSTGTFSFNGSSYIDLNSSNIITGNNPFTVEAWYYTNGTTADEIFGNYGTGSTSGNLWISGRYGTYINGAVYFPGAPIAAGTYCLTTTRDSVGNVILYKNGVQVNSGVLSASIPVTYNFRIGADVNGAAEPFTGTIYSVKVYSRILSATEVQNNFNAHKGRYGL
jgi:hypothetical protein